MQVNFLKVRVSIFTACHSVVVRSCRRDMRVIEKNVSTAKHAQEQRGAFHFSQPARDLARCDEQQGRGFIPKCREKAFASEKSRSERYKFTKS